MKPLHNLVRFGGVAILILIALFGITRTRVPSVEAQQGAFPYYVQRVADIAPGPRDSDPAWFTEVNGDLYFRADGGHGAELWKYSPLTGEASLAANIFKGDGDSNPEWLTVRGNSIYFAATDALVGRQLWRYNTLTGQATRLATREFPLGRSPEPKWLEMIGPILYYSAYGGEKNGRELYAYDTNNDVSWLVKDIHEGGEDSDPEFLYAYGSTLYFTAKDEDHGRELWRSDGTPEGTYMIKDIFRGPQDSDPGSFNMLGDLFIFSAEEPIHGRELWKTYGTEETTELVKDIYVGKDDSDPGWSNRLADSLLLFPAETEDEGVELWRYDLQSGAYLVDDINVGDEDGNPAAIGYVGWTMFFSADDGDTGIELWKSEPPYAYATQIEDINIGDDDSEPTSLGKFGTTLFFTADDGIHGEEVWVSEFPYNSAHLLRDIKPGSHGSIPVVEYEGFTNEVSNSYRIGWTVYFTANDGKSGVELWQISLGALPQTGFAPDVESDVAPKPDEFEYRSLGGMWLEIPELEQSVTIVGVPKEGHSWRLDWLEPGQVGYLNGTAFPTWQGNTAISGHVYLSDGSPGPFADLESLAWGDEIILHAWGQEYVYEVRRTMDWVDPNDESVLAHKDHDWITLITCKGYDQERDIYHWRTVVQAVIVEIVDE
jgi:LPXTG-site transpeptidase (sortase) family protein